MQLQNQMRIFYVRRRERSKNDNYEDEDGDDDNNDIPILKCMRSKILSHYVIVHTS